MSSTKDRVRMNLSQRHSLSKDESYLRYDHPYRRLSDADSWRRQIMQFVGSCCCCRFVFFLFLAVGLPRVRMILTLVGWFLVTSLPWLRMILTYFLYFLIKKHFFAINTTLYSYFKKFHVQISILRLASDRSSFFTYISYLLARDSITKLRRY